MSFFGFDTTLPRDRGHQKSAPGFSHSDAFAGLSDRARGPTDDDALDFDDTYDGLGDQLEETGDDLNEDTFGAEAEPATQESVGRDFDFGGATAAMSRTMQEEQMLYQARQPPPAKKPASPPKSAATKPKRSGYESYAEPGYIPRLEANASLWGIAPKKPAEEPKPTPAAASVATPAAAQAAAGKKMMSLEEVEAMMRAQQTKKPVTPQPPPQVPQHQDPISQPPSQQPPQQQTPFAPSILQRPPQSATQSTFGPGLQRPAYQAEHQALPPELAQSLREMTLRESAAMPANEQARAREPALPTQQGPTQPRQILQNPNRLSGHGQPLQQHYHPEPRMPHIGASHSRGPSFQGPVVHAEQLMHMNEAERKAYLVEDARRAKRNHKIHLLSKDNGLMTPQDKNFITRIQLQQLVAATGNIDEQNGEAALNEDFYYQVYSQIRGAPRQNPHQPANQFAQTYLFQTGGRYGLAGRRHHRGADNHMQRMEQQVQRAVEAAKLKPKNKQLVIEGSLGKISFSNAKTPKPLLNIKRPESSDSKTQNQSKGPPSRGAMHVDNKSVLKDIENVYTTLMRLEDHERHLPPPVDVAGNDALIHEHIAWQQGAKALIDKIWSDLKVMEPIIPNSPVSHPFIAILSHPKGKKTIPRVFRHIDEQQRITLITMIVVHLDGLDVVRLAMPPYAAAPEEDPNAPPATLPRSVRDEIDLFHRTVMPSLFAYVNEAPLSIVSGLLGLVLDRTNVQQLLRTRVGLSVLAMLVSRAELVKSTVGQQQQQGGPEQQDWDLWAALYGRLFDAAEPALAHLFPGRANDADDVHVWQFLAAMGAGASPEQQQRLVLGVKDRVMETVAVSKGLPQEMAAQRLGNVNLFMRAIGLDVELLS
ncbi:topoisomerase II-associated protein PAT1 [Lineolata rhizophorae]|uniref:Topoisomerase II-associated protein PAT1 n=1 Tax=Lineolata rhizophorae TaxID=578093 RepID=A0A6A6P5Q3_9PEZI|nr:topoisomerase II-associated protein PAT1 [Lineolata rhizophorae]